MSAGRRIAHVALALTAVTASAGTGARPQQPTFRARTDIVSVPVTVMRDRQPVTGLSAADFEILDNGVRQTVDAISSDEVPLDVTLVLTEFPLGTTPEHVRTILSADTIHRLLRPADRVRLVIVEDHVTGRDLPPDFKLAEDPVVRLLTWGRATATGYACCAGGFGGSDGRHGFGLALADGLFYALARPVDPDRRHLVVAFTDGFDSVSTLEIDRLPRLAARSDAVLHGVFWTIPGEGSQQAGALWTSRPAALQPAWAASYRAIDAVIRQTGGSLHRVGRADSALADIIAAFRSSYILRFAPRDVPVKGWHDLRVRVTRPGSFTIRARRGYEGS